MRQIRFTLLLSLLLSMAHMNVFAGNIVFADANVKAICVANWDTNHDGELSEAEAAAVMSLGEVFKGNTEITSFDELQYFTGLTSIDDEAFMSSSISSVVFPKNITSIGNCAFAGCDDLGSIILPEGVVNIGSSAFAGLSGDQSHHEYAHGYVYFPSTIKTVGENAFWRGVGVVEIADLAAWCGIDFQGAYANPMSYNGCIIVNGKEVTDLVIPEGVTSIGTCAFIQIPGFYPGGNYIQSVKLPSTLVTIGNGAFGRSRISGIDIPSSVKSIGSGAFAESSLTSVMLHEGLETIEGSAFYDCDGLTSIDIPAGVTISEGACSDCDNLTSVRVREGEPSEMDVVSTFSNCANATLYTPGLSLRKAGGSHNFIDSHQAYMDNWPGFKEYVAIEEDDDYFYPMYSFTDGEFGCQMRVISAEQSTAEITAFGPTYGGGSGTFNVPSTVASEQSGKVYTITTINRDSGFDYSMMSSNFDLKLPSSITYIKSGALPGNAFRSITVDAANPVYDSRDNCNAVIKTATNELIAGCFNTTIPESVTAIGEAAFADITSLKEITIPANITSIGRYAFWGCENLTSVTVEWAEPITLTSEFDKCLYITLYVPYGTKAAYEAAPYWGNFKEIIEYGAPEVEKYTLEILGHFNPDESYLYDRDGKEYDVTDFAYNEFDEGSYIRIEPFVYPGSYYIREILVNGESVGVWTDENTAPTEYIIENLSCNTTVEFKTYYNTRIRTLSCRVEGSGNVKMYKNNVLVGTTADQGEPRYCSAVFDEGDVLKLEFIPNAGSNLTKLLGGDFGDVESMVELTEEITDNIYTISFPSGYHGDYPLLRCFYASFEKETQDYSLTVDPGNYCTVEHLYVKKGDEVIETIDGGNSCSVEEGCSVGIELSVPAGLYIREIIVNDVTVATYTDEDVANGNNPDGYLLENISENTIVKFKTYPNVLHRNVGCTASGPGKVEMYRNGNYVGTTTSQDGGYPYLTCEALDEGEVLKLVFVSDKGGSFTKLMAGEHDGYEDTDFTGKVVDNTLTITMDFDNEEVLQYRSFIAYFKGPEPSTNNTLSASVPTLLTGKTSTMSLSLTNEDVIIACEFDLQLPNGITLAKDDDGDVIRTLGSRASKHALEVSDRGNGIYHFLCYSNTNKVFTGNEGELLSVEFVCDESMAEGTYEAMVKNIILSDPDLKKLTLADYTFGVEVIDANPGDVNNDGDINVMDVVQTVAYIMGNGTADFIFGAADMDNDGSINVVDLVRIVSMIMTSPTSAPAQPWTDKSLLLNTRADGTIAVGTNTDIPYVASEFIVEVGSGQSLEDVTTDKQHRATFVPVDNTHYKVMTYSSSNQQFADTDAMLTLHVSGEGLVTVRDAMLVDEDYKGVTFAPTSGGYTTGIMQMENGKLIIENPSVYDLQGRKHDTLQPFKHEVLIVNGKKQVVK
jgi:hypothetical protein